MLSVSEQPVEKLEKAVALRKEIAALQAKLSKLFVQEITGPLTSGIQSTPRKRTLSAEARAKLAAAAKARWAKRKATQTRSRGTNFLQPNTAQYAHSDALALRQIRLNAWPDGVSRATLVVRQEPGQFEERFGWRFEAGFDELDFTKVALVKLTPENETFALVRHVGCPSPGTELWIRDRTANKTQIIADVLRALGLSPEDITWKA